MAGTDLGYYPASLFSPNGLGTLAHGVQVQGETYDDPQIEGMTVTDMGSGKFPNPKNKRTSAYMRYLQIQNTVEGYDRPALVSTYQWATNPKCYSFIDATDATDDWHSQFYYGGPGQNDECP